MKLWPCYQEWRNDERSFADADETPPVPQCHQRDDLPFEIRYNRTQRRSNWDPARIPCGRGPECHRGAEIAQREPSDDRVATKTIDGPPWRKPVEQWPEERPVNSLRGNDCQ